MECNATRLSSLSSTLQAVRAAASMSKLQQNFNSAGDWILAQSQKYFMNAGVLACMEVLFTTQAAYRHCCSICRFNHRCCQNCHGHSPPQIHGTHSGCSCCFYMEQDSKLRRVVSLVSQNVQPILVANKLFDYCGSKFFFHPAAGISLFVQILGVSWVFVLPRNRC